MKIKQIINPDNNMWRSADPPQRDNQRIKATNSTFVQAPKAPSCNKFDHSALSTQNKHLAKQPKHITPTGQHPQKCRNYQFLAIPKC